MAVTKSRPHFVRPTVLRPLRASRVVRCDALDQWLAAADMTREYLRPLFDDEVVFELHVSKLEVFFPAL